MSVDVETVYSFYRKIVVGKSLKIEEQVCRISLILAISAPLAVLINLQLDYYSCSALSTLARRVLCTTNTTVSLPISIRQCYADTEVFF